MEKYHLLKTEHAAYIEACDGPDTSDTSEEDFLEKQSGFGGKETPICKRHAPSVLVHLLLFCVNVAICIAFLKWTIRKYPNGFEIRYSIATTKTKG